MSNTHKNARYTTNENYFEKIDTEEKAYWLGYIYADGCIHNNLSKMTVSAAEVDKSHMQKFLDCLESDQPIREQRKVIGDRVFIQCSIEIARKKIAQDLISHGLHPKKSLTLTFPNEGTFPTELTRHFLRGYFDGDGSIHNSKIKNVNKKNSKAWKVYFMGTKEFLKEIKVILKKDKKLTEKPNSTNTYYLSFGGVNQCLELMNYLYKDATIYLDRKKERYEELKIYIEEKKKHPGKEMPVIQYNLEGKFIKRWLSAKEAATVNGWDNSVISKCAKGRSKTAYKYKWEYENKSGSL